ncbi:hypothetical protein E4U37_005808 [Claviceps purpurea]|nr:hypothetical protein E4U37_005808 [Claviceps purpurea]
MSSQGRRTGQSAPRLDIAIAIDAGGRSQDTVIVVGLAAASAPLQGLLWVVFSALQLYRVVYEHRTQEQMERPDVGPTGTASDALDHRHRHLTSRFDKLTVTSRVVEPFPFASQELQLAPDSTLPADAYAEDMS